MTSSYINRFNLNGRVAVVTGASGGIGHAISLGLASAGADVFGIGRSKKFLNSSDFNYLNCDINNSDNFSKLIEKIFDEKKRIDILVNAAGITLPNQEILSNRENFLRIISCNLSAVYECSMSAIPFMIKGNYGSIVNITSIGAKQGFPGNPGYVASKGGLASLTQALALDFGAFGVRVNSLAPGYIRTSMTQFSYNDPAQNKQRSDRTILGRWGEADELAGAAIFLASPASSYMTGAELVIDGGWTAKGL